MLEVAVPGLTVEQVSTRLCPGESGETLSA
jgi:hypothetical protein